MSVRDLNDLSAFVAVVASGGFSAAARATGAPKSRISRRVAALEAQLGVQLIERSTRRFKVTDVGEDVYRHARAALSEAEAIDQAVLRLKAEPQGLVRVSCPIDTDRLLGVALPAFLAQHPKLRIQFVVSNRRIDLIDEGVDIAVRVRDRLDTDPDPTLRTIGPAGLMLVASPALVAAHGEPATPADIARFPTLGHSDRPGFQRWTLVDAAGNEAVVQHEPRVSAGTFPILREAAFQGMGLAILPEWLCREPLADGRLVRLLPNWSAPQGILHLVFSPGRGRLPSVRAVIEFVVEVLNPRAGGWQTLPP